MSNLWQLVQSRLTAVGLGAITVLGFAPANLWLLPFLTLAGLYVLWQQATSPRDAALNGWLFGLGLFGAGVSWVYVSLHEFGGMPAALAALATFLFCAFLALFYAVPGYLYVRHFRHRALGPACFAALLALSEWIRGLIFTGFPWLSLGYSQGPESFLAALAPVGGVFGMSLAMAVLSAALVEAAVRRGRYLVYPGLLLLGAWGLSWLPPYTHPVGQPVSVALLQGNIGQSMKWAPEKIADSIRVYDRLINQSQAAIIITPETAWPLLLEQMPTDYLENLQARLKARNAVLLAGVPEQSGGNFYNSMVLISSQGVEHTYRKQHLVPFGEYIPPAFGWVLKVLQIPMSNFSRGEPNQPPFRLHGLALAMAICYEDVFGEEVIAWLPAANVLVNVSNDAWFGKSFAAAQHLEIARMRAMETGRMMLRATNTGMTAAIDAQGRIIARIPPHQLGLLEVAAQPYSGMTPYARIGNYGVVVLSLLLLLGGYQRDRTRRGRQALLK